MRMFWVIEKDKMEKDKNIWLTKKADDRGSDYGVLGYAEVYDHPQAVIYYESGIKEIDVEFEPEGYIKNGFVCDMCATENAITLFFFRFKGRSELTDLISVHIYRDNISRLRVEKADDLIVVKKETKKHEAKAIGRRGFALAGNIIGGITKGIISANTTIASGKKFILEYTDINDENQSLCLYSPNEYSDKAELFLNTFYKSELPEDAKQNESESSNSSCYIATACYKDLYAKEVIFFRKYRDSVLNKYILGRYFVSIYYLISPIFYKSVFNSINTSKSIKKMLDFLYNKLNSHA